MSTSNFVASIKVACLALITACFCIETTAKGVEQVSADSIIVLQQVNSQLS